MRPVSRSVPALALVSAFALMGCNEHLLGMHDIRLDYEVTLEPPPAGTELTPIELARYAVMGRLAAAQVAADVESAGSNVLRITVDAQSAESLDEFILWRGGLRFFRFDPTYTFAPSTLDGLTAKTETLPGGHIERYFVGSADAVFRAVRSTRLEPGHRIVIDADGGKQVRTRAVFDPPIVDLTTGIVQVDTYKGRTLALTLTRAAQGRVAEGAGQAAGERVAVVRDASVVTVERLDATSIERGALLVPIGYDLYAYARAQSIKRLLDSPTLPRMVRVGVAAEPPNWPLALASLALPMLLSFAWLFFVRRFDRARPEPVWLVLATFALGGLSVLPAGLFETILPALTPYLNPSLMTLGGQLIALPIALVVFTLVVGLSEEGSKLLGAWAIARTRREFDEPIDGIVYGAASSLGFAAVENVRYFAEGRMSPTLIVMRAFTTVPGHLFFGTIWGYALGRRLVEPRTSVLLFLLWAAVMHGAFDTFLSIDGLGWFAGALNLGLATIFVVLMRRALRHGVVTPEAAAVLPASRALYRMGSRGMFLLFAVAMHVIAFVIFALGAYVQARSYRVGFVFVGVASALLAVFGLMAYGLSETMPLDVVVDDYGVTFGGAVLPWADVQRWEQHTVGGLGRMHEIRVQARGGSMNLGPGPAGVVDQLGDAISRRLAARGAAAATS